MTTVTDSAVDRMVEDCKGMIREDGYDGCDSFIELHEHVDANDYLSLAIEAEAANDPELAAAVKVRRNRRALALVLCDRVDAWLKGGAK